jgi:DNA-binding NtrC family response regulator
MVDFMTIATTVRTSGAALPEQRVSSPPTKSQEIVGQSNAIRELLAQMHQLAHTSARVLITGETGSGKELVASHIHSCSSRRSGPFIAVNCAGIPETLLESELFGHVKGSFTGAYRDKPGKFELANTGTLFLDEVGEMTLRMQGLLLRVLETGEIQKIGADRRTGKVDCRVVAATHRDLHSMIGEGLFREDLYYRLNVMCIHVPPLRERAEDIPMLVDVFLQRYCEPGRPRRMSPDACAALQMYQWPGNIRQLQNVVQRLVINTQDATITLADLPQEIARETQPIPVAPRRERRRSTSDGLYQHIVGGKSFWATVYEPFMERDLTRADVRALIVKALEQCRGNYRGVSRLFNLPPAEYKRFLNFLRKHECLLPFRDYR